MLKHLRLGLGVKELVQASQLEFCLGFIPRKSYQRDLQVHLVDLINPDFHCAQSVLQLPVYKRPADRVQSL